MDRFGFLGLGIMGSAMARNLLRAGYEVIVWNRTPERCSPLAGVGARLGRTPGEVARACPVTLAMVADPSASGQLCFGDDGVLEAMGPGKGYVDFSTVDPETSRRIASAVRAKGGRFLEAPVSGSRKPAEDGTLVILAAGDRPLYDDVLPALEVLGQKCLYLGDVGAGAAMKLVVNLVMGEMMVALCEAMALARRAGLSCDGLLDVLSAGALANPLFAQKGPKMLAGDFEPSFPLKHAQKDLRLALALGDRLAQPLPTAAAANECFKAARALGADDEDFSAVFRAVSA
ncbi:MAG: NAD(P)-dependent oxidoreductase [Deferrisomatales bacterium]|nr:NAD(P)-dependent oxidoreductase [Deferrisomatales bacterium]